MDLFVMEICIRKRPVGYAAAGSLASHWSKCFRSGSGLPYLESRLIRLCFASSRVR